MAWSIMNFFYHVSICQLHTETNLPKPKTLNPKPPDVAQTAQHSDADMRNICIIESSTCLTMNL